MENMSEKWTSRLSKLFSLLWFFLLVVSPHDSVAQVPDYVESTVVLEQFGQEDGMSLDNITSLAMDSSGFLWVGTQRGLNRFDGHRFLSYFPIPGDSTSLPANRVEALHMDPFGQLWVGLEGALLARYDEQIDAFSSIGLNDYFAQNQSSDESLIINTITDSGGGHLWVGTTAGLFKVTRGADPQFIALPECTGILSSEIGNPSYQNGDCDIHTIIAEDSSFLWLFGSHHTVLKLNDTPKYCPVGG